MECLRRSVAAFFVLGLLAGAFGAPPKPGEKAADKPTINEIGGKTLNQWIAETKNADAGVRENAVRTIMLFGPAGAPAAHALVDRLLDPDVSLRVNACLALGSIDVGAADVNKAVDELARRVTDDREGIVRFHAAMALVTFGKEAKAAIPKLITASRDGSSWEIRKAAVMALGKVGVAEKDDPLDMRAANNLISVLNTEATAQVRLEAAIALGSMGKPARTEDLVLMEAALKRATGDRDLTVRIWAAVGFMAITEKVPEEYLVIVAKIMKAPELVHRCHAARALGTIGEKAKSRVPDLIELLADKQREAQASSVWALGRIGDARALPALQELSQRKDIDEEMKQYLKGVIENLSKKK